MKKIEDASKSKKGITLIALVLTIIILIILAGTSISMLTGQNGILTKAKEAKEQTGNAVAEEQSILGELESQINDYQDNGFDKVKGVNRPQLASGMTRIMFKNPEKDSNGKIIKDGESGWSNNWYDYNNKKWANVMTEDGSMWVWIPRYAYIINSDKTMDIKFLIGTTNKWYNQETKKEEDLPEGYKIHPCFQNGKQTNYKNGEWKEEIRGIWISKFEAGLPDDSSAPQTTSVPYMKNSYYPVFQGKKISYNYITSAQCYLLSRALTESGNPYGFSNLADSHMIKNSEWGATAFLSYSKYGKTGGKYDTEKEVILNNVTFGVWNGSSIKTSVIGENAYAITGYAGDAVDSAENILTSTILGDTVTGSAGTSYAWYTEKGKEASTTGNLYGVYDMSGGATEYTSSYVNTTNATSLDYLKYYASVFAYKDGKAIEESTPYATVYSEYTNGNLFIKNEDRYGDALWETENWFGDWINNDTSGPILARGGFWVIAGASGIFGVDDDVGYGSYARFSYSAYCAVNFFNFT